MSGRDWDLRSQFQIRAATHAANQGSTNSEIKDLNRWKSDAYQWYVRNLWPRCAWLVVMAGFWQSKNGQRLSRKDYGYLPGVVVILQG